MKGQYDLDQDDFYMVDLLDNVMLSAALTISVDPQVDPIVCPCLQYFWSTYSMNAMNSGHWLAVLYSVLGMAMGLVVSGR